jgi:ABC-type phosphate transport system substrate-binding protein
MSGRPVSRRRAMRLLVVLVLGAMVASFGTAGNTPTAVAAPSYQRISGEGSSWAANAIDAMRVNVQQFGITVDYNPSGSSAGRKNFLNGTVDFAASDIPFQFSPEDGSAPENPAPGSYAYMPVTAGGTAFMYNLKINGQRVTNLRLSGENIAKIFTGAITMWNDPAIQADNPGLTMPARTVVAVVRSDGSGSSAQFTGWMINRHGAIWNDYCSRSGRAPACGQTSFYPTIAGMISQSGDLGIAGYVSQGFAEGAIGYVNYSYALGTQFPVVKVLNAAGYYTEPTPENVAVSLLQARINTDESNPAVYLTQQLEGVYADTDPRSYQLSSYSYLILPTKVAGQFNEAKGLTLGAFAYYAMCQAQQSSASLGYSPMPINLVEASFDQIRKIPGVVVQDIDIRACKNPTFSDDGTNTLAANAPQPLACDKQSTSQCPNGTGGMANVPTEVLAAANGATPAAGGATPAAGGATPAAGGATPAAGGATPAAGGVTPAAGGATPAAGGATPAAGTPSVDASGNPVLDASGNPVLVVEFDPANCDLDTGVCGASAGQTPSQVAAGAAAGPVTATTLGKSSGWNASLLLVVLVILLTLALVFVPALAWRHFAEAEPA